MNQEKRLADSNGVVRISRKGKRKFAFGDGEPFEIEVTEAYNRWCELDEGFRLPDGTVDKTQNDKRNQMALEFVQTLTKTPNNPEGVQDLTMTEALEFIARLVEQAVELMNFFVPRTAEKPSSQPRLEMRLGE